MHDRTPKFHVIDIRLSVVDIQISNNDIYMQEKDSTQKKKKNKRLDKMTQLIYKEVKRGNWNRQMICAIRN